MWYRAATMIQVTGPYEVVPGQAPKRHVRVYVPRRAQRSDRPILFLFDGQNVFDDAPSFAGGWHAHLAVERLARKVPAPVIVGLDHGNEQRISELSPFDFGAVRGELDRQLAWIADWLLPKLRADHALTSAPSRVVVGGSSMGGLASLYAALSRPDIFGGALSMSPSLWVGRGAMFRWAEKRGIPTGARIYIDGGAKEPRMIEAAGKMADLLGRKGIKQLCFRPDPKGDHSERSWRRRLLPAMRFHFGTSRSAARH